MDQTGTVSDMQHTHSNLREVGLSQADVQAGLEKCRWPE